MYLVVASVAGSGTRFVFEHLLASFVRCRETSTDFGRCDGYFVQHVNARYLQQLHDLAQRYPCIIPMRHPRKVAETWGKRIGRPRPTDWDGMAVLADDFRRLITVIDPLKPYYLPVDAPDRDDWLAKINADLELDLQTDWPLWMSNSKPTELIDSDVDLVDAMLAEFADFFGRFGYGVQGQES